MVDRQQHMSAVNFDITQLFLNFLTTKGSDDEQANLSNKKKKRDDKDPVCGKHMNRNKAHITIEYKGEQFLLCCPLCQGEFEHDPEKHVN